MALARNFFGLGVRVRDCTSRSSALKKTQDNKPPRDFGGRFTVHRDCKERRRGRESRHTLCRCCIRNTYEVRARGVASIVVCSSPICEQIHQSSRCSGQVWGSVSTYGEVYLQQPQTDDPLLREGVPSFPMHTHLQEAFVPSNACTGWTLCPALSLLHLCRFSAPPPTARALWQSLCAQPTHSRSCLVHVLFSLCCRRFYAKKSAWRGSLRTRSWVVLSPVSLCVCPEALPHSYSFYVGGLALPSDCETTPVMRAVGVRLCVV